MLLSIPLLKQAIGLKEIAAGCVSYTGVLVISTRGDVFSFRFSDPLGITLALGSTVIWAFYWIYNTKDERDPVVSVLLNFLLGFPFIFVCCLVFSDIRIPSIASLLGAMYIGIVEMGITFVLWLSALKLSENTAKIGNLIFLSPFLSLVFIHFLVGEEILPSTFIGLALIVGGLILQRISPRTIPVRTS
jgi:drug/metabolite transporter (DMT)-like permease